MTAETKEFFEELGQRGHEPLLRKAKGVIRFEVVDDDDTREFWTVAIDHGDIDVSDRNVACDCTLRAPRALFERIRRGETNATAAVLRGAMEADGDWRMLVLAQRLFRAPAEVAS